MENKWVILILFFAIFISFNYNTYAAQNIISNINIEAVIEDNGNIRISETIIGDFYLGTELYKSYDDLLRNDISNFVVSEDGIKFENIDEWKITENRENKKKKSSIIESPDGIELVWGIGDQGKHQYHLKYDINGIFQNSELELKFIDLGSLYPENAKITIKGNFDKNIFTKTTGDIGIITKDNGKIIYNIENVNKDISIYLNYNGIDNSSKNEQIIKIKSNDKTKILKFLRMLIILLTCFFILIILFLITLNKKKNEYAFKPF